MLVAGEGGRYVLRDPDGATLLEGEVGQGRRRERRRRVRRRARRARPGTQFQVARLRRDAAIAELQEDLRISEKGKKTGILQLALEGDDPARIAAILDALSRAYVRRNVERKSAEAEKTLEFLEAQLPELRGEPRRRRERVRELPRAEGRRGRDARDPGRGRARRRDREGALRDAGRVRRAPAEVHRDAPGARRPRPEGPPPRGASAPSSTSGSSSCPRPRWSRRGACAT